MELSYEERAKLSEELWWSLHPPAEELPQEEIDAAWDAEIKRRIEEIDSGAVETIPGEEVLARMDARLNRLRKKSE
jgi:putative addiction module component (TIGR02574 family)